MRILLLTHAFNSLAQRLYVELAAAGHALSVEFDINDAVTEEAVALFRPDIVLAPFLKRAIPATVWQRHRCLVVHPGIVGDRGPSALDWAIFEGESSWGVTVLEATGDMDAGPVWASATFPMRPASKSSLYRHEVTEAAVVAVRQALAAIATPGSRARPVEAGSLGTRGRLRPAMRQADRAIDWARDGTDLVLRKLRAADGAPGVRGRIAGLECHLFDGHPEALLNAGGHQGPGTPLARREGAVCLATRDGAVWVTHLRRADVPAACKLPAAQVLGGRIASVPDAPLAPDARVSHQTWRDLVYEERDAVGYLHFPFYNGAMSTRQCARLRAAYAVARTRPTRVLVLTGGPDFWSNGMHLHAIEADEHPAEESWRNINAMDDLVRDIVCTGSHLVVSALRGNAGAGGVFLALAADHVWARSGVVLNPHYRGMGNLYGSEYWTYLLPRRVPDAATRHAIVDRRLPLGAAEAAACGLVDAQFGDSPLTFEEEIAARATRLAAADDFDASLAAKRARRAADEAARPLASYRDEELGRMQLNFFGFDPSYHVARFHFVARVPRSRTPLHLAVHRRVPTPPARSPSGPEGGMQAAARTPSRLPALPAAANAGGRPASTATDLER